MKWMAAILLLAAQDPGRARPDPFEANFALVKASAGEARWDEIEWTTSLWEGRKRAAAEGKPLFIWAANGNPLGLTWGVGTATRARSNWSAERVALLKKHFVPVVITVHGECKDAEGAFWKSFCKDYAWITGAAHGVTPSGKILCADVKRSSCGGRSVCDPFKALDKWQALPEEERRPGAVKVDDLPAQEMDSNYPKRPEGSLILKGYNRPLDRGADGKHKRLKEYRDCQELGKEDSNWQTFVDPEPGRVWLWFTREQWKSIVPPDPKAGLSVPLSEAVADRIVRLTLLNTIYWVQPKWRPEEIRSRKLTLTVDSASPAEVRLKLSGTASLKKEKGNFPYAYEPEFSGVLVYDRKKEAFTRFDVLALGDWTWGYKRDGPQVDLLGVALELWPHQFASPAYDRHFPGWNMSNYGYRQDRE